MCVVDASVRGWGTAQVMLLLPRTAWLVGSCSSRRSPVIYLLLRGVCSLVCSAPCWFGKAWLLCVSDWGMASSGWTWLPHAAQVCSVCHSTDRRPGSLLQCFLGFIFCPVTVCVACVVQTDICQLGSGCVKTQVAMACLFRVCRLAAKI